MQYSLRKGNIANFMFVLGLLLKLAWGLNVEAASLPAAANSFARNGKRI